MENRLSLDSLRALSTNTAIAALGIELVAIDEQQIELRMPITNATRQPMGLLHGGVSMVLAETAASMHALWLVDATEKVPVGIEINGSHLRSASEGTVKAIGIVLRRTRPLVFYKVDISHEETGQLLSVARVTNYYKPVGAG
jgi:uncharacterized protein (TIGR00369 family)